jgi:2-phosphosulfolactate phosphatase
VHDVAVWFRQDEWDVRFEWGATGVSAVGGRRVAVVDVLRFTTAVDAGTSRGARIFPYRWKDASAADFAASVGAVLAQGGSPVGPSLSPVRLLELEPDDRVVLPSPNGSTCATAAREAGAQVVASCLRNAEAVARWVDANGGKVTVIACGERWPDGTLRPSLEDHLGAGALISALHGTRSPEAEAAAQLWEASAARIVDIVGSCASGREAEGRGWADDLAFATEVGASATVPVLHEGSFVDHSRLAATP